MTLHYEEREAIVAHRIQRANETLIEAKGNIEMGFWHSAANRLYYACYYAVCSLLIKNGYNARTHSGVFGLFGLHFVSKGLISKEQNKFYRKLFDLRQNGDYDDWFDIEANDVQPLFEPAKAFIAEIENLIESKSAES